jgi:DNA phosphorothioation-dependent restriction protein DptG
MCQGSIPIGPDLTSLQNLPNPTELYEPDLTFFVINLTTYFLENVDALAYMYGGWGGVPAYPY